MIAKIQSLHVQGMTCTPVDIEVDVSKGLPQFVIVGLPDAAVSEARDRVRAAIQNSGFSFPRTRVTVNLAPAHAKKAGSLFDVPIALGILLASGVIQKAPDAFVIGELALDGSIRSVRGALPLVYAAVHTYKKKIIVPAANSAELSLVPQNESVFPAASLESVVHHCTQNQILSSLCVKMPSKKERSDTVDIADIVGQQFAKRSLEIAAAGAHNIVFIGSPGAGKTLLAQALVSLLPEMTKQEMLETTMIHSVTTHQPTEVTQERPFRAPHHTATVVSIIGGGPHLNPGEISLAHHGVLFFDELPEFQRSVLEALRQPLESGVVTISRAAGTVIYPAQFQYVAALNPCPCGFLYAQQESTTQKCQCSAAAIERYQKKLSGPLLDRIDIKVKVSPVSRKELLETAPSQSEKSADVRLRVSKARKAQYERQKKTNAFLTKKEVQENIPIDSSSQDLLHTAIDQEMLTMRGYIKTIKVARTIADLEQSQDVLFAHIAEAFSYTKQQRF